MKIRVPILTCLLFMLALTVALTNKNANPYILGLPFGLCFGIGTSFLLCFYYSFEVWLFLKGKR